MNSRKIERLDNGILIPGGAKGLQIRDRRAPPPKVGAGIGGWFQLELVDRRGRLAWEHQQHNLFLDSGLNRIGQNAGPAGAGNINANDLSHFAVGTGSTTPDVTDTVLDNELARTNTLAPDAFDGARRVADGEYELERTFQLGFAEGNGNLTEVGCAFASGPGNLWMRELIRDSGGTPITLTKTSDFILRAKYTLRFTLTPTTPTVGSFTVAGWGLLSGVYMFRGGGTGAASGRADYRVFRRVAADNSARGVASAVAASTTYTDTGNIGHINDVGDSSRQVSGFTPGIWEREVDSTFGVSQSNGTIATIGIHGHSSTSGVQSQPGFLFLIDEDDRHAKDNEHTLTIERIIGVTWGRS